MAFLCIAAAAEGTANRIWNSSPRLRLYSGTHTISVPDGYVITSVTISQGKWNTSNTFNGTESSSSNWTGCAQTVELGIAGNTQIKKIEVEYANTATITLASACTDGGTPGDEFDSGDESYSPGFSLWD